MDVSLVLPTRRPPSKRSAVMAYAASVEKMMTSDLAFRFFFSWSLAVHQPTQMTMIYMMNVIPPMTATGILLMRAVSLGQQESTIIITATIRRRLGSQMRLSRISPVVCV